MLNRVFTELSLTALALLFKRLVVRRPPRLHYRKAESEWPSSYRKPR